MPLYIWAAWLICLAAQSGACYYMRSCPWRAYLRLDLLISLGTLFLCLLPIRFLCVGWQWSETPILIAMTAAGIQQVPRPVRSVSGALIVGTAALCMAIWLRPNCNPREIYVQMLLVARITIEASVVVALIVASEFHHRVSLDQWMVGAWMGCNATCYLARMGTEDVETARWINVFSMLFSALWYTGFMVRGLVQSRAR